eukprot:1506576-Rhodomonas_salina.3
MLLHCAIAVCSTEIAYGQAAHRRSSLTAELGTAKLIANGRNPGAKCAEKDLILPGGSHR